MPALRPADSARSTLTPIAAAVDVHRDYIRGQVLADGGIELAEGPADAASARAKIGGDEVVIQLVRVTGS